MKRGRLQSQRSGCGHAAFTLVEVALSVAIAAVALSALLAIATSATRTSRQGIDDSVMATIAHDLFAEARASDFASLADAVTLYDADGTPSDAANYRGPYFRCEQRVLAYPGAADNYSNYLKRVELWFSWPATGGGGTAPFTNTFYLLVPRLP